MKTPLYRFLVVVLLWSACSLARAEEPVIDVERTTVIMHNGEGYAGYILGVDSDSLTLVRMIPEPRKERRLLKKQGQTKSEPLFMQAADTIPVRLARRDIRRIVAQETRKTWRGFTYGTLSLIYVLFGGYALETKQPGAFLGTDGAGGQWPTATLLLASVPIVGIGGGIGAVTDRGRNDAEVFFFAGEEDSQEWERFRHFLIGGDAPRLRLSVASSMVVGQMGKQFEQQATTAAFTLTREQPWRFPNNVFGESNKLSNPSDVNAFRRVQLLYALTPRVELGVSVVWLGEPILFAHKRYTSDKFSVEKEEIVGQRIAGRGYYTMGMYNVQPSFLGGLTAALGVGAGFVFMEFQTEGIIAIPPKDGIGEARVLRHSAITTKTLASGVLVGELSGHLYKNLSLGITADYAFASVAVELPPVPQVSFPAQRFTPGNASIGVTVGLHF